MPLRAGKKGLKAIDPVHPVHARRLLDTVKRHKISMYVVIPTAVLLVAAKGLGAARGKPFIHVTSIELSEDLEGVVGYAEMVTH